MRESGVLAGVEPTFVPHQANMYIVRQLADALGLKDRLAGCGGLYANTGSCSAALTLAAGGVEPSPVLLAGFGAGLSAGAAATEIGAFRKGVVEA